jgi:dolichyl-phosphate-mannose--protein O-mannosyl transferase
MENGEFSINNTMIINDFNQIDYNIMNNSDITTYSNTIKKKSTYTPAHFRAQTKYREKYPEKYKELQKKYYETYKLNDEWRNNFNAKARENNKKCRERKKQEKIDNGELIRGRGRPAKIIDNNDPIKNNT